MTFCWGSRDRLAPMRMIWLERNYNEPRFAMRQMMGPRRLRAWLKCDRDMLGGTVNKVELDRENRQRSPGKLGDWPLNRNRPKRR
jgi:hypothetical protein